jgi:catechol 2,3-dioxygenase-like lactoylglutathione lyase family enzyme
MSDPDSDSNPETHADTDRARLLGINHVALPVGDVDDALAFYRDVFDVEVRGRTEDAVFLEMGDQFLPLMESPEAGVPDVRRHVGLVVDDKSLVAERLDHLGVAQPEGESLDFKDPWGNRLQVVEYGDVQFTKADHVLDAMGLAGLAKSESALAELAEKGMAPEDA